MQTSNTTGRREIGVTRQPKRVVANRKTAGGLRAEWDVQADMCLLEKLAAALNAKGTGLRRDRIMRQVASLGLPREPRDWRGVAWRWLRRHGGGAWVMGGSHVGRLNFGPMIMARALPRPTRRALAPAGAKVVDGGQTVLLSADSRQVGERRAA